MSDNTISKTTLNATTAPWDDPMAADIDAMLAEDEGLGHDFDDAGRRFIRKLEAGSSACRPEGQTGSVAGAEPGMFQIGREIYEDLYRWRSNRAGDHRHRGE
jgi:hypothetical protein